MSANGEWPEGLTADVQELPSRVDDHSSPLELAQAYASIALAYGHEHPKIVQALEFLRDAGHDMAIQLGRLSADVKRLADARPSSIPPMRPPLDSSSHIIEQAKHEAGILVKEEAQKTIGPLVDPEAATRIAGEVFARKMAEREAEILARTQADKLAALEAAEAQRTADKDAAEKLRKSDAHKLRQKIIAAVAIWVVLGALGALAGVALIGARVVAARAAGHAEGVQEVRSLVAPAPSH